MHPLILHRFIYKIVRALWFSRTHFPLFQDLSLKIYINFFLSSGGYNFKINYSKDKMRHGMLVHTLLKSLASSPFYANITFRTGSQNAIEKKQNFMWRYLSLKFSWNQIIKIIVWFCGKISLVCLLYFFSSLAN